MSSLVDSDIITLINRADSIVSSCTGTNCNISPNTRRQVVVQLSELSQDLSRNTLKLLSLPPNTISARNITAGYIQLSSTISSVYNYSTAQVCVTSNLRVIRARDTLISLLITQIVQQNNDFIALSIISVIIVVSLILFLVFLIIGL